MSPTSATKTAPRLSRDVVVERALQVADAEGLDAVTIRRLATELAVTPMALYWHFRTKDDLLGGLADLLLDAVVLPPDRGHWRDRIGAAVTAMVTALRPHPQVAPLVGQRMLLHPTGLALTETALGALAEAGFDTAAAAMLAGQVLTTVIQLVTADMVDDSGAPAEEREEQLRRKHAMLGTLDPARYPHVVAAAADMTRCADDEAYFDLGIDLLLAGLQGLAPTARA